MPSVEPKVVTIEEKLNKLTMVYEEQELDPFVSDDEPTEGDEPTEEKEPTDDDEAEGLE